MAGGGTSAHNPPCAVALAGLWDRFVADISIAYMRPAEDAVHSIAHEMSKSEGVVPAVLTGVPNLDEAQALVFAFRIAHKLRLRVGEHIEAEGCFGTRTDPDGVTLPAECYDFLNAMETNVCTKRRAT